MQIQFIRKVYTICYLSLLLLLTSHSVSLFGMKLHGDQIITTPKTYDNVLLQLGEGRFTITGSGALTIQNSTINVTISLNNPYFILLTSGNLNLTNNIINVKVSGIQQKPDIKALFNLIHVIQGSVAINQNTVTIDTPYTVSFFETQTYPTKNININYNSISTFHGGLALSNSDAAVVTFNTFSNVSYSNIYSNNANLSLYDNNLLTFPGNLKLGNGLDIVNSDGLTISNNIIASAANVGISITGGNNIFIENNKVSDCRSYAIRINSPLLKNMIKNKYLMQLIRKPMNIRSNNNIFIANNYLALNKFGVAADEVERLIVTNNVFIQRFDDIATRKFWTDNNNLLPLVANLTWTDNLYKEAFTQDIRGNNALSLKFVTFPTYGGVFLEK